MRHCQFHYLTLIYLSMALVEGSNDKWYIGIWYNKISTQTIVWVANRGKPISDPVLSNLIISDDGNLVLLANHSKSPMWSTDIKTNTSISSTMAVLNNTGNLVLKYGSDNSTVLWQSFDDFTDTWLPGNKLSRNKKTGAIKRMVSWKDRGDPAPGLFSIQLDSNGSPQYILQWNSSIVYWNTGNWSGNAYTGVPELSPTNMYPNSGYTFQFVDNDVETYLSRMMRKHLPGLLSMCQVCSKLLYGQMQLKHGLLFSRNQQLSAASMECVGKTASVVRMLHHHAVASWASLKSTQTIGNWMIIQQAVGEKFH
jgi:hypothetical protein